MYLEFPKSPNPRKLSLFGLSGNSLKSAILRACLYLTWIRTLSLRIVLTTRNLPKTISGNCLTSKLPEVLTAGTKNRLMKNLKRKSWRVRCPQGESWRSDRVLGTWKFIMPHAWYMYTQERPKKTVMSQCWLISKFCSSKWVNLYLIIKLATKLTQQRFHITENIHYTELV